MMTNTYLPHVGGVARSVATFATALRRRGHDVMIVAPTFDGSPPREADVLRLPALQRFNGSDFSVRLPIPGLLYNSLEKFQPQIIHTHHPFLLGDTALRTAVRRELPLVFTHHTMYERYTHYVPGDSHAMQQFVARLATEYANLCDHVIAPSQSIEKILRQRDVNSPISSIPTGVDVDLFAQGCGRRTREKLHIPPDAFVLGHVGRLAPEKNLELLSRIAIAFLKRRVDAHFLVAGSGPSSDLIQASFHEHGLSGRLHLVGTLQGQALVDAYHAMDVFAFASMTETQGMVLAEALAGGVPVIAIDAPGVREIVVDRVNGRLLGTQEPQVFLEALHELAGLSRAQAAALAAAARTSAAAFGVDRCTDRLAGVYQGLIDAEAPARHPADHDPWMQALRLVEAEWNLWNGRTDAALRSLKRPGRKTAFEDA